MTKEEAAAYILSEHDCGADLGLLIELGQMLIEAYNYGRAQAEEDAGLGD